MSPRRRDVDVEAFPPGTRVVTPAGRLGTVLRHKGHESRRDHFMRVTVRYDGGGPRDLVTLQARLLRKVLPARIIGIASAQWMEIE